MNMISPVMILSFKHSPGMIMYNTRILHYLVWIPQDPDRSFLWV